MDKRLKKFLPSYNGKKDELIPILQDIQGEFGYLPEEAMLETADFLRVPESHVYAVASFYEQFRFTPMGRKRVMVCRGTACYVRGTPRILGEVENVLGISEGETTEDMEYTLETVACIGCCALSPCIMINNKVHARLAPAKVREIFAESSVA